MEREKTITVKWINKDGYSRIAFLVDDAVYLLVRRPELQVDKTIFGLEYNKEHEFGSGNAKFIWCELKNQFNFEEVKT